MRSGFGAGSACSPMPLLVPVRPSVVRLFSVVEESERTPGLVTEVLPRVVSVVLPVPVCAGC